MLICVLTMKELTKTQQIKSAIENGIYLSIYDVTKLLESIGIKNHGAYYSIEKECLVIPVPEYGYVLLTKDYMIYGDTKYIYTEKNIEKMIAFVNSN